MGLLFDLVVTRKFVVWSSLLHVDLLFDLGFCT